MGARAAIECYLMASNLAPAVLTLLSHLLSFCFMSFWYHRSLFSVSCFFVSFSELSVLLRSTSHSLFFQFFLSSPLTLSFIFSFWPIRQSLGFSLSLVFRSVALFLFSSASPISTPSPHPSPFFPHVYSPSNLTAGCVTSSRFRSLPFIYYLSLNSLAH